MKKTTTRKSSVKKTATKKRAATAVKISQAQFLALLGYDWDRFSDSFKRKMKGYTFKLTKPKTAGKRTVAAKKNSIVKVTRKK